MTVILKKIMILSIIMSVLVCFGCNKHGCPGIDKKTGEFKVKKKQKTKSGLFPK